MKLNQIKIFSKIVIIIFLVFVFFGGCKSSSLENQNSSQKGNKSQSNIELLRQPYLQNSFKDSISILWITDIGNHAYVRYGKTKAMNTKVNGNTWRDSLKMRNEVTIKGLERGEKYYYSIFTDDVLLVSGEDYFFRTESKETNSEFTFYTMGDIGEPVETGGFPLITAHQINNLQEKPLFGIGLGDIVYPDGESSFADHYMFKPLECILKNIPLYPALGNHDWNVDPDKNFTKEWKLPNNEHYYSFNYANAHFIALDTRNGEMYDVENQLKWFENDLKKSQGKQDWIFVYFHHNGKTCSYKPDYKSVINMYPLFAKYNVDIVFNGHAHTYERLYPLDKNGDLIEAYKSNKHEYSEIKDGFIQITTGAGGKLRKNWTPFEPEDCPKKIVAAVGHTGHFTLIKINGKNLELKAISSIGGAVLDSLYINKY